MIRNLFPCHPVRCQENPRGLLSIGTYDSYSKVVRWQRRVFFIHLLTFYLITGTKVKLGEDDD